MRWSISALAVVVLGILSCGHPYTQGKSLYMTYCVNCHIEDGTGLMALIPPLDGADYLVTHRDLVPCLIRYGGSGGIEVNGTLYTEPMPSFRNLNAVELSNLINYINTAWSNDLPATTPAEVSIALKECPDSMR